MSSVSCRFCFHANPPGARFCNECGSPLNLKPCRRCEAVNDAFAEHCHQCGMPFAPDAGSDATADAGDAMTGSPLAAAVADRIPIALAQRHPNLERLMSERASGAKSPDPPESTGNIAAPARAPWQRTSATAARVTGPAAAAATVERKITPAHDADAQRMTASERYVPPKRWSAPARGNAPKRTVNPFAVGAVVALAIGGYYAYQGWAPFTWPTTDVATPDAAAVVSRPDSTSATDPTPPALPDPAGTKSATDSTASSAAAPPTDDRPPTGDAPAANSVGATASPATPEQSAPTSPQNATDMPDSSAAKPATGAATPATAARATKARAQAAIDRDALATRRLIERDLGAFAPAPAAKDETRPSP